MVYKNCLSKHLFAVALLSTIISSLFFSPSHCGDSSSRTSNTQSAESREDGRGITLPKNRNDNNLSTSKTKTPGREALIERGSGSGTRPSLRSRENDAIIDFDQEGESSYELGLEEQQRPKRGGSGPSGAGGYYFYGHPHSPNFFDRYFDRSRDRSGSGSGSGRDNVEARSRLMSRREQYYPNEREHPSWGGKVMNKFRHRTNHLLNAASAVGFAHEHFGNDDDYVPDNEAAGSSHGGGYGGGGGGGYGKGVNKSAVGLLGFLSLLSLIQSGLTTAAPMPMGRRRRDTDSNSTAFAELESSEPVVKTGADIEREVQSQKIADIVLPLLTSFSFAMQEDQVAEQRLTCVLNEVCSSNQQLVTEFGEHGKDVGLMLGNVLESMAKKMRLMNGSHNEHLLKLKYAARTGRNGKSCESNYPKCSP